MANRTTWISTLDDFPKHLDGLGCEYHVGVFDLHASANTHLYSYQSHYANDSIARDVREAS